MNKNIIGIIVVVALVVGGGSFYAGMQYGKGQTSAGTQGFGQGGSGRTGGNGSRSGRNFGTGGSMLTGSVLSLTGNTLTIKNRDGSTRIVLFSDSTTIGKQVAGQLGDVAVGSDVSIFGTSNTDGSVTASNIQIRPPSSTRPF